MKLTPERQKREIKIKEREKRIERKKNK